MDVLKTIDNPLPSETESSFLSRTDWRRISVHLNLSQRESEIAFLMLGERTESAIAHFLCISPHTVHAHLERLYRKLGIHQRYGLVARVFRTYIELKPEPAVRERHAATVRPAGQY